jgi:hypothetical protein
MHSRVIYDDVGSYHALPSGSLGDMRYFVFTYMYLVMNYPVGEDMSEN